MKKLILLRHAKSSWDDLDMADIDRPLNKRGRKAAPLMGKELRKREVTPDLVLCSPAKRTRETHSLFAESAKLSSQVEFCREIYEASSRDLLGLLRRQDSKLACILVIGHNPGMESLLYELTGKDELFPTAAMACINTDLKQWEDLGRDSGQLEWIARPKELH